MEIESKKDKKGRLIQEFDIVRIFHFRGVRRKIFYMYKIAMRNPNYKWLDLYDIHELAQLGKENAHRCTIRAAESENMEIISEHYREE